MSLRTAVLAAAITVAGAAQAQPEGQARPIPLLSQVVPGMPRGETQQISVLTASFRPGDRTVFHTHRHPVTVYILEGAFTLEMEGHPTVTVGAGQSFVEPPGVRMTGYNRSATDPIRLVIFYVGDPGTPFLDVAH